MEKEVASWLLGGFGAFKLFEPLILKFIQKKEQEEDSQSTKIDALNKRCECIEKDILTIQAEKVSRNGSKQILQRTICNILIMKFSRKTLKI